MAFLHKLTNVAIQKPEGSGGSGLITPPDGWYELGSVENPGLTIGTHAEGLHNYDDDIAVGPSAATTDTVVTQYTDGVGVTGSDVNYNLSVIRACSCSLALDPIVSIVLKWNSSATGGIGIGVVSEDVSDNLINLLFNFRIGYLFRSTPALLARSEAVVSIGGIALVDGDWYQIDFEPSDYGKVEIFHLASGDIADRDSGTSIGSSVYNFDANLPGSVISPAWSSRTIATSPARERIRAVRITPRRTI